MSKNFFRAAKPPIIIPSPPTCTAAINTMNAATGGVEITASAIAPATGIHDTPMAQGKQPPRHNTVVVSDVASQPAANTPMPVAHSGTSDCSTTTAPSGI